jgi:hypothetical protein
MCASSGDVLPRVIEFLFSLNRQRLQFPSPRRWRSSSTSHRAAGLSLLLVASRESFVSSTRPADPENSSKARLYEDPARPGFSTPVSAIFEGI